MQGCPEESKIINFPKCSLTSCKSSFRYPPYNWNLWPCTWRSAPLSARPQWWWSRAWGTRWCTGTRTRKWGLWGCGNLGRRAAPLMVSSNCLVTAAMRLSSKLQYGSCFEGYSLGKTTCVACLANWWTPGVVSGGPELWSTDVSCPGGRVGARITS